MKKKRNILKRNSGFLIGCVVAAGASFFTADLVMSENFSLFTETEGETEKASETALDPETEETRAYETDPFTVTASGNIIKGVETERPTAEKETDENGNVISTPETDENGNVISAPETDENGNIVQDSGTSDTAGTDSTGAGGELSGGDSYTEGAYDTSGSASDGTDSWDSGSTGESSSGEGSWDSGNSGSWDDSGSSDGSGSFGDSYDGPSIEIVDPGNGDYSYNDNSGSDQSAGDSAASTPSDVIIQGISSRYISESELYNYSAGQLRLIRNEIFALNGRIFHSQDLADYFSQKSWYVPMYSPEDFDANMFYYLNDYEEANLQVILNYEAALAGN